MSSEVQEGSVQRKDSTTDGQRTHATDMPQPRPIPPKRRSPPSVLCTLLAGSIPLLLLGSIVLSQWIYRQIWPPRPRVQLILPPMACPDLPHLSSPEQSLHRLWRDRAVQNISRSPQQLFEAIGCERKRACSFFVVPISAQDAPLLLNWARFASELQPPLDYVVLPLDEPAQMAVVGTHESAPPWSIESVFSQFHEVDALELDDDACNPDRPAQPCHGRPRPGWLAAAAPLVYLPFEDGLLGKISAAVSYPEDASKGDVEAVIAALSISSDTLTSLRRQFLARPALGAASALRWRALATLLDPQNELQSGSIIGLGNVMTLLLTNPLPHLSTQPEVRGDSGLSIAPLPLLAIRRPMLFPWAVRRVSAPRYQGSRWAR